MIERVILNILKENGFDGYEALLIDYIKNSVFTYRKNDTKIEFFIVVSIDQKDFLSIDENKIFSDINKSLKNTLSYTAEVDKNTSLVLCVAKDSKLTSFDELEKKELRIEENPYFFKKYVLTYDEKIAQEVFGEVLKTYNESSSLTKYIESIVTNPERFRNFKINAINNEDYMLLSKIVMKVPVMPVKVPDNQSIKSLESMIQDNVISKNLQKSQGLVAILSSENSRENVEKDDISQIIDYWLKEQV
ncbi:hypothetical protein G9F71_004615 [Clostridium sp. FP2]|uniref:ABC-three component system middle component 1 n=1 Tax=Clostridium sp. FP2 TaxID=2724481 RepID=UPI0013E990D2|nr:ABC-three component system middle component 1 [Clostridium sp. FP2]MBZ9622142.1 hypothetical protein [Clostridium sp. FP2]